MPFIEQEPQDFNRGSIEHLKPNQNGVYGILRKNTWIYIGKGDIRERLLDHLNGDNPCILSEAPTHFVAEVLQDDPSSEEQVLISEFQPICNRRVG